MQLRRREREREIEREEKRERNETSTPNCQIKVGIIEAETKRNNRPGIDEKQIDVTATREERKLQQEEEHKEEKTSGERGESRE